ncbi:MAG: class I SAM-dependent methyltransferase [Anaerolineales bacterium]
MQKTFTAPRWESYALLDSGKGRKLEQFGPYRLVRPEPRAVWRPALPESEWTKTEAEYIPNEVGGGGEWVFREEIETKWAMNYRGLRFWCQVDVSKQVGVFPENAVHWDWIEELVWGAGQRIRVLNLFGYTGLASLASARAGAAVTHVDASQRAVRLGRENQVLNGLEDRPIRWIVEDAFTYTRREVKRGSRYEGLILDPPKYGLGPKKERWEFFKGFGTLCETLGEVLSDSPLFMVVTAYALERSPEVLVPYIEAMMKGFGGKLEYGDLVSTEVSAGRKISQAITARWKAG